MVRNKNTKLLPMGKQTEKLVRIEGLVKHIVSDMAESSKKKPGNPLNSLKVKIMNKLLV